MRIALYAPLKPLDHPVPSGDRRMARALADLLRSVGHEVQLPSQLRSFDRTGNADRQLRVRRLGGKLAERLVAGLRARPSGQRPELWFTYHLYHKAPDYLGPRVSAALNIPYVVAEASVAARQASGPWAIGHAAAVAAIGQADAVLAMTERDRRGLESVVRGDAYLTVFPPFLATAPFRAAAKRRAEHRDRLSARLGVDAAAPWLLAVAMMRADVKQRSYQALAEALGYLRDRPWQMIVVGDGPARPTIETSFAPLGADRVRLLGALPAEELPALYAASDLYLWPGLGEAYGMALLEAQAAGLPVVAGREGGIPEIVTDGETGLLVPADDAAEFARTVRTLLDDRELRARLGAGALTRAVARHDIRPAGDRLALTLTEARDRHARRSAGAS